MEVKIITDVAVEPVTLSEIKNFCRVDDDYVYDDDTLLLLAAGAREKLEKELNLSFAEKTIMVQFNGYQMDIPYGPVISIESVNPFDDDQIDTPYTASGLDFKSIYVNAVDDCVIIYPVNSNGTSYAYNLTYTAGYETLPKLLKQALLIQIDYDFKNQGMPIDDISQLALDKARPYSKNLVIQ